MNNYELVIIFDPVLSDDELNDEVKTYGSIITEAGGSVSHDERWGLRPLAYPIKRKTTGIYYLAEFSGPGEVVGRLETQFGRDDKVIRQLITSLDKYAVAYNERRRRRMQEKAEAKEEPKEEPQPEPVAAEEGDAEKLD